MENLYYLIVLPFVVLLFVSVFRTMFYGYKLDKLVREKYPEKWKYITTIPGFGPGCTNGIRSARFLWGDDDFGDAEVLRLKIIVKRAWIYSLTSMPAMAISFAIALKLTSIK